MKITGYRVATFTYSRGRKMSDANGVASSDRTTGSLLFIDTDKNITGVAPGGSPEPVNRFETPCAGDY